MRAVAIAVAGVSLLAGCTSSEVDPAPGTLPSQSQEATPTLPPPSAAASPTLSATPQESATPPRVRPDDVRRAVAMEAVRHLAGEIGPRPGTSPAFHEAADWVEGRFAELDWQVEQQSFRVPGGASVAGPTEGLPVEAGRSANVVATRGDVVEGEPWLLVGAHLDTVPTAPGAEDNASGVGALLAVAEAIGDRRTRLPVVLVAFGAEEPRGPGDDEHHYGSRHYVGSLTPAARRALRGMVSMDRVGVGDAMPVGSVEPDDPLREQVVRASAAAGEPTVVESGQRSSDHWSFVREGLPGVRLGSTPYAGYHSPDDVVAVVEPAQVTRAARIVVAWLR